MNSKLKELEFRQEKDIKNSYLVINNVHIDRSSYEAKVFDEISIDNVMKYAIAREEGKEVLKYDINNAISLNEYLKLNKLKKKDMVFIIKNIYDLLGSIENYLISENSILLDTKALMISKVNDKTMIKFCIIPCLESDFSYELSRLLVRLLRHIDTKDSDALNFAYNLFLKSSKKNYSISDLMQVVDESTIYDEEKMMIEQEREKNIEYESMENYDIDLVNEEKCYAYVDNENESDENEIKPVKEYNLDIEIDEETKKDLNLDLFDKIEGNNINNKINEVKEKKPKKHKGIGEKLMLNANIKFHIAIFPILAILVPAVAYFAFGFEFFKSHYVLFILYEVVIILIISLNSLMDSIYKQF